MKRALITGGNSGIGFETALELAKQGYEIVLPARSLEKAEDAKGRILKEAPTAVIHTAMMDLASLKSVQSFGKWFGERFPKNSLDFINNAGVMAVPQRELTVDGYERQFATNYLGPFLLTALLYPYMKQKSGSRIVIVSSSANRHGKIDFDNLQSERKYSPMWQAYGQSKLADSIFALELSRRLKRAGSPIMVTSAHPGYAVTNLQTSGPGEGNRLTKAMNVLRPFMSHDAKGGAQPTLYAALSEEATPGGYYGPKGFLGMKGAPGPVEIPKRAQDEAVSKRLWTESERLVGTEFLV